MKIIDLSHKIINNMPVFPGDDAVIIHEDKILAKDNYNAVTLKAGMHVGTHIDIPRHLLNDDRTIDEISIDKFIGNGVLLDVRGEDIISFKREYEYMIDEHDIVLLYTGYADFYTETDKYYKSYPVIGDELADFFVAKKIKMLGMDTPSPDKVPFDIHKKLLGNDVFIVENLTNLVELNTIDNFDIYAVPLKIEAEASIVRAFAVIRKSVLEKNKDLSLLKDGYDINSE